MVAAASVRRQQHRRKEAFPTNEQWIALSAGLITSVVVAFVVIAWFMTWVRKHGFTPFAIYRVVAGIGLLCWDSYSR